MSSIFRTIADYELYLYTLPTQYSSIRHSTLVLIRRGAALARVEGELLFDHDIRLIVRERLLIDRHPIIIHSYGYEIWKDNIKQFWYDSQPHPNEPTLQSTHPHHKHIPPDIKHNRVPAPTMSFSRPNLSVLIQEIDQLITELD